MESKKYKLLGKDCESVSEVIGQVLMIAMVVLAFATIAVTVFSNDGFSIPPHIPRVDLQEKIDRENNVLFIFHTGGETVNLKDVNIVLNTKEKHEEFNFSCNKSEFNYSSNDDVLMLGDYIIINPTARGIDLRVNDTSMYFVHNPSQELIQKVVFENSK